MLCEQSAATTNSLANADPSLSLIIHGAELTSTELAAGGQAATKLAAVLTAMELGGLMAELVSTDLCRSANIGKVTQHCNRRVR